MHVFMILYSANRAAHYYDIVQYLYLTYLFIIFNLYIILQRILNNKTHNIQMYLIVQIRR